MRTAQSGPVEFAQRLQPADRVAGAGDHQRRGIGDVPQLAGAMNAMDENRQVARQNPLAVGQRDDVVQFLPECPELGPGPRQCGLMHMLREYQRHRPRLCLRGRRECPEREGAEGVGPGVRVRGELSQMRPAVENQRRAPARMP